jgi:hypothetical protein
LTQASAGWTGWLEATAAATAMRQWLWLYPIVEILLPWARASLLVIVPTGGLMFVAHATEFAGNPAFRLKLLLLVLAGLNAAVFHLRPFRQVAGWDRGSPAPWPARLAACLSLALWTGVIACGRLLAYF